MFSAKEAAYKALWPLTLSFLDFHEIEVTLAEETGAFTVASRTTRLPDGLAAALSGRYARIGELFATGATLAS